MSKKAQYGKCKICGKETELTFEHVPPFKAFNSRKVKKFGFDDTLELMAGTDGRLPWDTTGLKGEYHQKGYGDYYLCPKCNNDTGSWYMNDYVVFANTMAQVLIGFKKKGINNCSFWMDEFYPLRVFKAVMTMFCDINHNCFGDERLRQFILNKESNDFDDKKYTVSMFLCESDTFRMFGVSSAWIQGLGMLTLSEVASFPLGFLLYIDKPEGIKPPGIVINDFVKMKYNEKSKVECYGLPIYEINSNFPGDYRTKDEIIDCINQNRLEMKKMDSEEHNIDSEENE